MKNMALKIYNTRTRKIELFEPLAPPHVKIYICGLTVYDFPHIGHARTYISFDMIIRYLKHLQYHVEVIQNITDVDDKMIRRANEEGITVMELGERFISAANQDFEALSILFADNYPRATQHIDQMIEVIQELIKKGNAYEVKGDVYFNAADYKNYGAFSKHSLVKEEDAQTPKEENPIKHHPADFALWKAEKPGEISWESPWGLGRPGWHIECSAMSHHYLGAQFDIHGGGQDLIFPHHENEIAQSEAYSGKKPFVKYWMHTGFLNIKGEKMSKSLGNFITIRELLKTWKPDIIRFLMLSSHYRRPMDFSLEKLHEASRRLDIIENAYQRTKQVLAQPLPTMDTSDLNTGEFQRVLANSITGFFQAMDNDFNTPDAIAVLFSLVSEAQIYIRTATPDPKTLSSLIDFLDQVKHIFGISLESNLVGSKLIDDLLSVLIEVRQLARTEKNFRLADLIRDKLHALNIDLQDFPEGTMWQLIQNKESSV